MKLIPLNKDKFAKVDDKDFEWLSKWRWRAFKSYNVWYAYRTQKTNGKRKQVFMHRLILGFTDPQIKTDHKDGDGLNNQRDNLRKATNQQNGFNRRPNKNKITKGVSLNTGRGHKDRPWHAYIKVNNQLKSLGYHASRREAAKAYNKASLKYFGEFAQLNNLTKLET